MPSRRQERVARIVKEVVSEVIANHLSDPRLTGLATVTKVEMAPDLRSADVFLSLFAATDGEKNKSFAAITHAAKHIQSYVGAALTSKFCPVLHFHRDEHFQKTLETMRLIDRVHNELQERAEKEEQA